MNRVTTTPYVNTIESRFQENIYEPALLRISRSAWRKNRDWLALLKRCHNRALHVSLEGHARHGGVNFVVAALGTRQSASLNLLNRGATEGFQHSRTGSNSRVFQGICACPWFFRSADRRTATSSTEHYEPVSKTRFTLERLKKRRPFPPEMADIGVNRAPDAY